VTIRDNAANDANVVASRRMPNTVDAMMSIGSERSAAWAGRRVVVTGHTGFKGAWLSLWLWRMGAEVWGFSDGVPSTPAHTELIGLDQLIDDRRGNISDPDAVSDLIAEVRPDVVFHLAAQSLVRPSYVDPAETFQTNVMGAVRVLDASIRSEVPAVIVAATDKCYENREWGWGYREDDPLGGHDPYSASKGAAEIVVNSFRRSFPGATKIASIRAGNVVGPGDWSVDRLIPDAVRAATSGTELTVRNPGSTRPWQDVLDCLAGYLRAGELLLNGEAVDRAWNIGPAAWEVESVGDVVARFAAGWGAGFQWRVQPDDGPHEAGLLALDPTDARRHLGWAPIRTVEESIDTLVAWHRAVAGGSDPRRCSLDVLDAYAERTPLA